MTTNDHGKKISEIWFAGDGNAMNERIRSNAEKGIELGLSATHHGDRDEFWVLVRENQKESARYNVRNLSCIVWGE